MAGITLTQAEAQLTAWLNASSAVATGQAYEIDGRKLTRADADSIQRQITYWQGQVARLSRSRSGIRIRQGVPG